MNGPTVIVRGRQAGKTTEAIWLAAEKHLYIVVATKGEAGNVNLMAKQLGLDIPFPLTWQEFVERKYFGKGVNGFIIDNAERLLQSMTEVPIEMITINAEDEE